MDQLSIPNTLEECFEVLKTWSGLSIFKNAPEDSLCEFHHTVGRSIRNNWGLWSSEETPLKTLFHNIGIQHPDDMSGIIILSFHRHLHGKDIKLEEQVEEYKTYWKTVGR